MPAMRPDATVEPTPGGRTSRRRPGAALAATATLAAIAVAGAGLAPSPAASQVPSPTPTPSEPDLTPPVVTATTLTRLRSSLVAKGMKVQVTLNEPGSVSVVVRQGSRQLSRATSGLASMPQGGTQVVTTKLTPAGKARARRTAKIRWTVEVLAYDARGNHTTVRLPFKLG